MRDVGIRLKEARENAGFETAAAACDRFGWTYPTYSGHENGSRGIRSSTIIQYARAFRVDPEWLLTGKARSEQSRPTEHQLGFSESSLRPISQLNRAENELSKSGVLSEKALRPMVAQQNYPQFAILEGDTIFFDDSAEVADHDLCIVNIADTSTGAAITAVRQIISNKVVKPAFSLQNEGNSEDVAVMGKIVAVLRLAK